MLRNSSTMSSRASANFPSLRALRRTRAPGYREEATKLKANA